MRACMHACGAHGHGPARPTARPPTSRHADIHMHLPTGRTSSFASRFAFASIRSFATPSALFLAAHISAVLPSCVRNGANRGGGVSGFLCGGLRPSACVRHWWTRPSRQTPPPRTASVASRSPPPAMSDVRLATSFEIAALSTDIARILAPQNDKAEIVVLLRVLEAGVGRESSTVFACSPAPKPKRICPAASEHSYQHLLRPSKLRAQREMSDRVYSTARSSGAYKAIVFKSRVVRTRRQGSAV